MTWFGIWHSEKSFLEASWRGLLFSPTALPFSARQVTWSLLQLMPSIHKTSPMIFFFLCTSHLTIQKKNMGLYSEVEKDAQPCSRWGNLPGSPAISWHVELQQSLIPVTCPHCYTHEVAESTKPTTSVSPGRQCNSFTHLRGIIGRGHRSRQEQSSRSSASNSATCLRVICFPSPVLPSVKCLESDFGLHFAVLWDVLIWSPTQELDFTIAAFSV